jgi:hypothetical protein
MDQTLVGVLNGIGVVGVVLFGGWLVASGRLVTRREVDRRDDDHVRETARQIAADQVAELLEHARTTDAFIRSLPHPNQERT